MTRDTTSRATAPKLTRLATISAIVATVLLVVTAGTVAAGHTDTNGLFYDDFDDDNVGEEPDDWTRSDRDDGGGTIEVNNTKAHVGNNSLYLSDYSGNRTAIHPVETFTPTTSNLSYAVYRDNNSSGIIQIHGYSSDDDPPSAQIMDIELHGDGLYFRGSDGSINLVSSAVSSNEWVEITVYNINPETNEYSIKWDSPSDSGTYEGAVTGEMEGGYTTFDADVNGEASGHFDEFAVEGNQIQGQVTDQNGEPVEGAVVYSVGYDTASPPQLDTRNLEEVLDEPLPTEWQDQVDQIDGFQPDSFNAKGSEFDQTVVFMHTGSDWEYGDHVLQKVFSEDTVAGSTPTNIPTRPAVDSDNLPVFACWTPDDSWFQDDIDQSVAGMATENCGSIVVEQIDPMGDSMDKQTVGMSPTHKILDPRNGGVKTHYTAPMPELGEGVYRVYPEGKPEAAMVYAVAPDGDVSKLEANIENLAKDNLTARTKFNKKMQELYDSGDIEVDSTRTGEDGRFDLAAPTHVTEAEIRAVRTGHDDLNVTTRKTTREDVRTDFEDAVNSSFRLQQGISQRPDEYLDEHGREAFRKACQDMDSIADDIGQPFYGETRTEVPSQNADIEGHRAIPPEAPSHLQACAAANLVEDFLNDNLGWVDAGLLDDIENMSPNELREKLNEVLPFLTANPELQEEFEDRTGVNLDSNDPGDYTDNEVKTIIGEGSEVIDESRNGGGGGGAVGGGAGGGGAGGVDVGSGSGEVDETAETISAQWSVGGVDDWSDAEMLVRLDWSNGTTTTLNQSSEHVSVEENSFGVDVVHLKDYPVGEDDPEAVMPRLDVATSDGADGGNGNGVANPTFDGTMPGTSHVKVSTLSPGPNDRVTVSASGGDSFGGLERIKVTHPDGTTEQISASDGAANFTTSSPGDHRIGVVVSNGEGTEFVEAIHVRAGSTTSDRPPTLKASVGPTGRFAVIGNGMNKGSIDVRDGASEIHIIGVLDDDPNTVSIHTTDADIAADATHSIELRKGAEERPIESSPRVLLHQPQVSDDAIFWRNGNALPRDEQSTEGVVETKNSSTVVDTFAEGGTLEIRSVEDPGPYQRLRHWADLNLPGIPFLTVSPSSIPAPLEILPILLALSMRRRDPPKPPEPPTPGGTGGASGPKEVEV